MFQFVLFLFCFLLCVFRSILKDHNGNKRNYFVILRLPLSSD